MPRHFNVAGPCQADIHYILPAMRRLPTARTIIDQRSYFGLHAPRQVGKTTALLTLAQELTREGRYISALLSMEVGAAFSHDLDKATREILSEWQDATRFQLPAELRPPPWPQQAGICAALAAWAYAAPRPLVLFLDKIDAT